MSKVFKAPKFQRKVSTIEVQGTDDFEEDVRKNWKMASAIVYKDLPRLASRITLVTPTDGIVLKNGMCLSSELAPTKRLPAKPVHGRGASDISDLSAPDSKDEHGHKKTASVDFANLGVRFADDTQLSTREHRGSMILSGGSGAALSSTMKVGKSDMKGIGCKLPPRPTPPSSPIPDMRAPSGSVATPNVTGTIMNLGPLSKSFKSLPPPPSSSAIHGSSVPLPPKKPVKVAKGSATVLSAADFQVSDRPADMSPIPHISLYSDSTKVQSGDEKSPQHSPSNSSPVLIGDILQGDHVSRRGAVSLSKPAPPAGPPPRKSIDNASAILQLAAKEARSFSEPRRSSLSAEESQNRPIVPQEFSDLSKSSELPSETLSLPRDSTLNSSSLENHKTVESLVTAESEAELSRGISTETVVLRKSADLAASGSAIGSASTITANDCSEETKMLSPPEQLKASSSVETSPTEELKNPPAREKAATFSSPASSPGTDDETAEQERNWIFICNTINAVTASFEEAELANTVRAALAAIPKEDIVNEYAAVSSVMTKHLLGTRTHRVFQAITQTVLAPSIMRIKFEVLNRLGTFMDVREDDGWKVVVHLTNHGYISIDHVRKEQTCEWPVADPNHYKVEWEMSMRFDVNMENMRSCMLKINAVETHPDMPPAQREKIGAVLGGGPMII
eukprot:TRINITY_DN1537_c0_g1_i1.p1 TRINITY_DN1537_c0_g1~~TRINITY_DN1537_c0_g1_i1.p1  ORF type:complete len:713 (+),score=122.48 TRINITY_DN1537_c0_g1_i1:107-2140(+)